MPQSVDEALHSMAVIVGLVVVAKTSLDEVVNDDVAKLFALLIREPPLGKGVQQPERRSGAARDDLAQEIRLRCGEPATHDSMSMTIVTGPSLTRATCIRAANTPV